jgi:hypothetical protein
MFSNMFSIWFQYGFNMVSLWFNIFFLYGLNIVSIGFKYGFKYGFNMVSIWFQYGFNMVSIWFQIWFQICGCKKITPYQLYFPNFFGFNFASNGFPILFYKSNKINNTISFLFYKLFSFLLCFKCVFNFSL